MKKYILSLLLLIFSQSTFADTTVFDGDNARIMLNSVEQSVNAGNGRSILQLLSPNASPELAQKILNGVEGKSIRFKQEFKSLENVSNNTYKIKGRYVAEGVGWNASGLSNYYIVENINGEWKIVDTDFYQFLPELITSLAGIAFIFPIAIFGLVIFWFVMFADLSQRSIPENKWLWYCLLFFIPFGSIIYFFTGRKKFQKIGKIS